MGRGFLSIFKRQGYQVSYPNDWSGLDAEILIEGKPLWDYVNDDMSQKNHELFKDYTFLITTLFDARVKSFITNILMGNGNKDKIPFKFYSYRVEFQARGMPHIHEVAWICPKYLADNNLTGYLCDFPDDELVKLVDQLQTCKIPNKNDPLNSIIREVQMHHHTRSCKKYNGRCRYGFPRLPCKETIVAKPCNEPDEKKKKVLIAAAMDTLAKAMEVLDDPNLDENMSFEEFVKKVDPKLKPEEYMEHLKITERGKTILLKREEKERNVNNYNPEMIKAWNANMDIQVVLDPYAVVTYMVNYINKAEDSVTKFMKDALTAIATKEAKERLKALKSAYFSSREIGASEAAHRVLHGMKLKN